MKNSFFPSWFSDKTINGNRAIAIMRKHGLDPEEPFGQHVLIEMLAARERGKPINQPWGFFVRFCRMAAYGDPEPLAWSKEAEAIRECLAKQGAFR